MDSILNCLTTYLSLGSNSPDAPQKLAQARFEIASLPFCQLLDQSSIYRTEPQDFPDQPWFHNQVLKIGVDSEIPPVVLMQELLATENHLGRVRPGLRFGPRAIDIDILLFGDLVSDNQDCILPHPRLAQRAFCLVPLNEIAPDLLINGATPAQLLGRLIWRLEGDKIFQ